MISDYNNPVLSMRKDDMYLNDRETTIFSLNPTISLFVHTDDPTKKMLIAARKEDSISNRIFSVFILLEKLRSSIANIYYKTFVQREESDDENNDDCYYDKSYNDSVKVESLSFQGFVLPSYHVQNCLKILKIKESRRCLKREICYHC
jgi:hypothetical protein